MGSAEIGTPVPSSDGKDGEFGNDDGGANGGGYFFGGLDAEPNVAFGVTDDHNGFEPSTLTSPSLLLHGFDLKEVHQQVCPRRSPSISLREPHLHNLILQLWQKMVDDLILLDWQ